MSGKFTKTEKLILLATLIIIILSLTARLLSGKGDTGTAVILGFTNILLYVIFSVCALFPADWRMTDKQKETIKDREQYKARYRTVLVTVTLVLCLALAAVIFIG